MASHRTPRICFSHKTALQILRAIPPKDLRPCKNRACKPPDRAPRQRDLEAAIERLEGAYPALRLEKPVHFVVASPSRGRVCETRKAHVCSASLFGPSFRQIDRNTFVSTAALAFVQMAACESSLMALIELGWELCGTYRTGRTGTPPAYQVPAMATAKELSGYASRNTSLHGARKAIRALRYIADGSASPRETKQALVLGLPMRYGGYGAGIPAMNYEVKASLEAQRISGRSSFRCDLCWPESKLDVEYQSKEMHGGEESRIRDSRRANALQAMGWTTMGITNDELDSLAATDAIAHALYRHLGRRLRVSAANHHARKLKLRRQLGLPIERW